jgi:sulfide-dependent adenosine diphosphate thiazole synthase
MKIDDVIVSKTIFNRFAEEFPSYFDVDVAIAGGGPAGLVAAKTLAEAGKKVVLFERKLSVGGGMWGGGMMFPVIVVQDESKHILEDVGINVRDEGKGYFSADSIESVTKLTSAAIDAKAKFYNAISVEDVLLKNEEVNGFVINWSAIDAAGLHIDPLTIRAKACIDATGHPAEVCHIARKKICPTTGPLSKKQAFIEGSMSATTGEQAVVENTKEVYPGLYAAGMCANAVFGAHRMGPIFGGMLLSGEKVSELVLKKLQK